VEELRSGGVKEWRSGGVKELRSALCAIAFAKVGKPCSHAF